MARVSDSNGPDRPWGERTRGQRRATYSVGALASAIVGALVYSGVWNLDGSGPTDVLLYVAPPIAFIASVYRLVSDR